MRNNHRSRTRPALAAAAAVAFAAACSASPSSSPPTTSAPPATAPPATAPPATAPPATAAPSTRPPATAPDGTRHQRDLSKGETMQLAAELVAVSGYDYQDISEAERKAQLARLPDSVSAAAFHGVIDKTTGKEVAFLVLTVPDPMDAMHAPDQAAAFGRWALGPTAKDRRFGSQAVWFAEAPDQPNSRYQYAWLRHGTVGFVDGPDGAAVDAFLTAFFAVPFLGAEDPVLGQRMVEVPGYSYTNAVDRTDDLDAAFAVFPKGDASEHYVFDRSHSFASILLVGTDQAHTPDELASLAEQWMDELSLSAAPTPTRGADLSAGPITARRLVYGKTGTLFVWQWPDTKVVGIVITPRPDIAEPWLTAYLKAQPAG